MQESKGKKKREAFDILSKNFGLEAQKYFMCFLEKNKAQKHIYVA